ncbi:hypothetical protein WN48_01691 [Eufriesea mexicana]|uniref:Uncharacterized protein n=1 Tax=Eufriesea mexicana TaxID=516756 RepID=A0A310SDP3_9HYME|nr:hypothetical protein WN48_01691 [Eufriesea mexicana]
MPHKQKAERRTAFSLRESPTKRFVFRYGRRSMPSIIDEDTEYATESTIEETSLDTKTHQPSFFGSHKNHFTHSAPPLDGSSRRTEIRVDSSLIELVLPKAEQATSHNGIVAGSLITSAVPGCARQLCYGADNRHAHALDFDCRAHPLIVWADWHPKRLGSTDPRIDPDAPLACQPQ